MRQISLTEPGRFDAMDVPEPVISPGHALVRVRAIGVCGTDLHAFAGRQPFFNYPRVLGHELGVEVLSVPEGDHRLRVSDRCAVEPYMFCGTCPVCQAGRTNCCETLKCLGVHTDGGMVERLAIPVTHLHRSEQLSFEQLALVETLGIGRHAVTRAGVQPFESVLVVGGGPIGLATSQFAALAGGLVTVCDVNPSRREFAERFGFKTVASTESLYDIVFDCTGSKASMDKATERAAFGGAVVFVGLVNDRVSFDDPLVHRRELTILASRNSAGAFGPIIKLIEMGRIDTTPWVTHRLTLDEVPSKFESMLVKGTGVLKGIVTVE
jgi:2-desacetyl-2-hydroxyethyl bacteriochlorophyllide A dehydrogenase